MANKRKSNGVKTNGTHTVQSLFADGMSGLGNILQSIEDGVEKAVSTVRKQGLKTSATINVSDIRDKAFEKTDEIKDELKKEIKRIRKFSGDLLENLKGSKIRDNVSHVFTRAQELEMVEFAKGKISDTKNQVFTMLQIPSQVELDNLARKVVSLEKKIKTISKHSLAR